MVIALNWNMSHIPHHWLEEMLRLSHDKLVVVDRDGNIIFISPGYCDFINVRQTDVIGLPVQEVIENSRMHIVAKTGEEEIEHLQPINSSVMIANRHPLVFEGELVGAVGTVVFPDPDKLRVFNNKISQLMDELNFYRTKKAEPHASQFSFRDLIGHEPSFLFAKQLAETVAGSDSSVLITGESGTGKELFANAIHHDSLRSHAPFVAINCASIPEVLFESELFGYEEGAFTGGKRGGKDGLLKIASGGTVFLDEIGDMPFTMQSKLLRVLQQREVYPVGGTRAYPVDIRIITATNRNLMEMVNEGTFREDLFYRLNVMHIQVPALKERSADIPLLANMLLKKLEKQFYKSNTQLSEKVITAFTAHHWPGNVRELENVLERAINVLDGPVIECRHLPLYLKDTVAAKLSDTPKASDPLNSDEDHLRVISLKEAVMETEKRMIVRALHTTNGDKLEAAKLLDISKTSLYDKCRQYGL